MLFFFFCVCVFSCACALFIMCHFVLTFFLNASELFEGNANQSVGKRGTCIRLFEIQKIKKILVLLRVFMII